MSCTCTQAALRALLLTACIGCGHASLATSACKLLLQISGQRLNCSSKLSVQWLLPSTGEALHAAASTGASTLPGPNTLPPPRLVQPTGSKAAEQVEAVRGLIARLLPHRDDAFLLRLGLHCHNSHAACFEVTVNGSKVAISGTTGTAYRQ